MGRPELATRLGRGPRNWRLRGCQRLIRLDGLLMLTAITSTESHGRTSGERDNRGRRERGRQYLAHEASPR